MHSQTTVLSSQKGNWLAITSGFLYGLLGYFGMRLIGTGMSALNISCWRFLLSFILMLTIFLFSSRKCHFTKEYIQAFLNGALFYAAPSSLFFLGSQYIGTGQCMVIFFSFPVFVMMLNRIFYGQVIKRRYFISFLIIIIGLIMLVDVKEVNFDILGIGLGLLSAVFYAFYVVFSKKIILPALPTTMMVSLGCFFTSLILALAQGSFFVPSHQEQWLSIIGLAIICTCVPIFLMLESLKYISSDRASLLSVLEPVFTVIFGVMLLGEILTMRALIGIIITLIGALTVSIKLPLFLERKFSRQI